MITKPTLLLDVKKCKNNIKKMAEKTIKNNVEFRPHFKTHQSQEIGKWFKDVGVTKITVSSLEMARYFADDGWQDITVAFPINILEIDTINELASRISLNILLESPETTAMLDAKLKFKVNAFIKINIGNNRAGLIPNHTEEISVVIKQLQESKNITFKGFLGHAGQSYKCRSQEEIEKVHTESISKLMKLKHHFEKQYPNIMVSVGDSPTCSVANDFSMVDEIRPGVFVFYDSMQLQIGSCAIDDIATVITCPVVAIHKERGELIIYGGSIHFASDVLTASDNTPFFGHVVREDKNGITKIVKDVFVKKISQEHGVISASNEFIESISIGDVLKIIPVHICTTANMFDYYTTLEGRKISRFRF